MNVQKIVCILVLSAGVQASPFAWWDAYKGQQALAQQDYTQALERFTSLVVRDPFDAEYNYNVGVALYGQKKYQAAQDSFARSAQHAHDAQLKKQAWFNAANAAVHVEKYQDALAWYDRVLAVEPTHEGAAKNKQIALELMMQQQQNQQQEKQQEQQQDQQNNDCSCNNPQQGGQQNNQDQQQKDQNKQDKQQGEQQEKDQGQPQQNNSEQQRGDEQQQQSGSESAQEQQSKNQQQKNESQDKQGADGQQEKQSAQEQQAKEQADAQQQSGTQSEQEKQQAKEQERMKQEQGAKDDAFNKDDLGKQSEFDPQAQQAEKGGAPTGSNNQAATEKAVQQLTDEFGKGMEQKDWQDERLNEKEAYLVKSVQEREADMQKQWMKMHMSKSKGSSHGTKNW